MHNDTQRWDECSQHVHHALHQQKEDGQHRDDHVEHCHTISLVSDAGMPSEERYSLCVYSQSTPHQRYMYWPVVGVVVQYFVRITIESFVEAILPQL
jgi:hypothetical protein